jgi:hypothetical protein
MLQAYIDDSCLGVAPVSLLAGWVESAARWAKFSDDWQQALSMSPRLRYFKLSEANSFTGEFYGWSERSRDERLILLVKTIADHRPMGFACAVPYDLYQESFGRHSDKVLRYPYYFLFNSIVADTSRYLASKGITEKVDFYIRSTAGSGRCRLGFMGATARGRSARCQSHFRRISNFQRRQNNYAVTGSRS